jgi:hypothetical protein
MSETDPLGGIAGPASESALKIRRARDAARHRRKRAEAAQARAALSRSTEADFHELNRSSLPVAEREAMEAQDREVRELMYSMSAVSNVLESDPELIDIVVQFVKDFPCPHLGGVTRDPNIPADWSSTEYWKDSELREALESENDATATFIRYGYLSGIPDWRVINFLHKKAGWDWNRAATLVGYHTKLI